jgi:hypothetical protein
MLAVAVYSSLVSTVQAQTATATLSVVVVDPSNAVVPGTSLTLINADTGIERLSVGNDNGGFTFSFVAPGRYVLKAEQPGFAPGQVNGIVLNVGDNVTLTISLKVGNVSLAKSASALDSMASLV